MATDPMGGYLLVSADKNGQVILNNPRRENGIELDEQIIFTPEQARVLARLLLDRADEAEKLVANPN